MKLYLRRESFDFLLFSEEEPGLEIDLPEDHVLVGEDLIVESEKPIKAAIENSCRMEDVLDRLIRDGLIIPPESGSFSAWDGDVVCPRCGVFFSPEQSNRAITEDLRDALGGIWKLPPGEFSQYCKECVAERGLMT